MYLVKLLKENLKGNIMGLSVDIPMSWADGQIGVAPIFNKYEDALKYSGDRLELIIEVYSDYKSSHS